jgi:hypothetical protein
MKNILKVLFVLALAIGFIALMDDANAAGAQSDDVSWALPTSRMDGTPLPASEIDRTEIEVSRDGSVVATDAVPSPVTAYTYTRPTPPNYTLCYRARVVDTDELASDWTSEVCKTVKGKPNPPSGMSVK